MLSAWARAVLNPHGGRFSPRERRSVPFRGKDDARPPGEISVMGPEDRCGQSASQSPAGLVRVRVHKQQNMIPAPSTCV